MDKSQTLKQIKIHSKKRNKMECKTVEKVCDELMLCFPPFCFNFDKEEQK